MLRRHLSTLLVSHLLLVRPLQRLIRLLPRHYLRRLPLPLLRLHLNQRNTRFMPRYPHLPNPLTIPLPLQIQRR